MLVLFLRRTGKVLMNTAAKTRALRQVADAPAPSSAAASASRPGPRRSRPEAPYGVRSPAPSVGTWTYETAVLARQLLLSVPPAGVATDQEVADLSDEDLANAVRQFRQHVETTIQAARPSEPSAPASWPTQADLDLDWQAYMMEDAAPTTDDGQKLLGIMDSACSRTCHGSEWGDKYRSYLTKKGIRWEELRADVAVRGIGGRVECTRAIKWPVGLFGRAGEILSLEIPDSSTPLLLSRQTQKTLGAVLDFANEEVDLSSLGVYKQKTEKAQGGHFALDITAFPPEGHPGLRRADDNETTYNLDEIHHKEIDPSTKLPSDRTPIGLATAGVAADRVPTGEGTGSDRTMASPVTGIPPEDLMPDLCDESDIEESYITALGNAREEIVDSDEFHPVDGDDDAAYVLTSKKAAKLLKTCNRLAASDDLRHACGKSIVSRPRRQNDGQAVVRRTARVDLLVRDVLGLAVRTAARPPVRLGCGLSGRHRSGAPRAAVRGPVLHRVEPPLRPVVQVEHHQHLQGRRSTRHGTSGKRTLSRSPEAG